MKDKPKPAVIKSVRGFDYLVEIKLVLTMGESLALKHALEEYKSKSGCAGDVLAFIRNAEVDSGIKL